MLLKDEAISGKIILVVTVLALIIANSALQPLYGAFWHTDLSIGFGDWTLAKDLRHWVNEGLMAIFFLVVGLELKRELVHGELRSHRTALLPFAAAIGGMALPALIFTAINLGGAGSAGWAIPMATDIAFAIGVLAILGKGIPSSIRLFLLTLAIVDDIGAVIIIAIFYNSGIDVPLLLIAGVLCILIRIMRRLSVLTLPAFIAIAVGIWLAIDASGVHASIAGALIGLLAPLSQSGSHQRAITERLERITIPLSTLFVIPLFAFANTGLTLSLGDFSDPSSAAIAAGIMAGLVIGKVAGITGASWLMLRLGIADLPNGANWRHIIGIGFIAGIGFTVAIFVAELAYTSDSQLAVAKISIFAASLVSGIIGFVLLRKRRSARRLSV